MMEIIDYSKHYNIADSTCKQHAVIFPKNIFCVIAGATGCGKTNLMVNLLRKEHALNYSDVYVYSSTLYQPSYEYLKQYYETFENFIGVKVAHFLDADEEIVDPSTLDKTKNHIMIFDDVMLKDQTVIKDFFCTGRHNNVNVSYKSFTKLQNTVSERMLTCLYCLNRMIKLK